MKLNTKIDNREIIKEKMIGVRFTPEEKLEIENYCKRLGLNVSSLIRYCIFKEIREK